MTSVACSQRSDRIAAIALHPHKPQIVYVATEESVYKTRDRGETWERLSEGLSRTRVMNLIIDPELPANVFAGTLADGVYKSPDGGRRWLPHNAGIQKGTISANVNQVIFDPRSSQTLFAATTVGVFHSTDGGQSWSERMRGMTEVSFVVTLAADPVHPNVIYAGTSGGVYRSIDSAENWVKVNNGLVPEDAKMASMALGVNTLVIDPHNADTVYAGTTKGLFKTTDRGNSWFHLSKTLDGLFISSVALHPGDSGMFYVGTSQGIYQSQDSGKSWQVITKELENKNIRVVRLDPQNPLVLYCGTNGGGLYRSMNGGQSWDSIPLTLKTLKKEGGLAFSPIFAGFSKNLV